MTMLGRRSWLQGALVAGLDRVQHCWVTHVFGGARTAPVPALDGALVMHEAESVADLDALDQEWLAALGNGRTQGRSPLAVLIPGSSADVVTMVRYANEHAIAIVGLSAASTADEERGHQTEGRARLLIDMANLDRIHEIGATDALVDAGVCWRDLVAATIELGQSPPTLTDYTGLRVGDTISVGGIGGQTHRHGFQRDNVEELAVVTGAGELVECSATRNRELFDAVRGGLGQFGIIVRARVRLCEVPPMVRVYTAIYRDLGTFTADQELLIREGRFDFVEGLAMASEDGDWQFVLEAARYYAPAHPPDDAAMLAGLSFEPLTAAVVDQRYLEFVNRLDPVIALLESLGDWAQPQPWLTLLLPRAAAVTVIESALARTTPEDTGGGPILIYPFPIAAAHGPYPVLPNADICYLFSLQRMATSGTDAEVERLRAQNQIIYELARSHGATLYPSSPAPLAYDEWHQHVQTWNHFQTLKERFDPRHVMAPGLGIPAR